MTDNKSVLIRQAMHSTRGNINQDSNSEFRSPGGMKLRSHGSRHDLPNATDEKASSDSEEEIETETPSGPAQTFTSDSVYPQNDYRSLTKRLREMKHEEENYSKNSYMPKTDTIKFQKKPENSSKTWIFYVIAAASLVIVLFAGYKICLPLLSTNLSASGHVNERAVETFTNELNTLKTKFPTQTPRTWRTISAVVKATLSREPLKSPGIITIAATSDATRVANCLGMKVAKVLKNVYNDSDLITLDGDTYSKDEASEAKLKMDQKIRNGLENGGHVVLFENFHQIPPASSVLFHGLCDNDNAPFKQAIYIFTVQSNDNHGDVELPEVTEKWMNLLDESLRSSLESRIGNSVVAIINEKLGSVCE